MTGLGRHGPKNLMAFAWNLRSSREALLEAVAEGLTRNSIGHTTGITTTDWQSWKTIREVSNDTLTWTSTNGIEQSAPALHFSARNVVTETQYGVGKTFTGKTTVTLDALVGYTEPVDEYAILLAYSAHPGWMARGSEILVYETTVAVRHAVAEHLRIESNPFFTLVGGGWSNLNLSNLGNTI